ncbi:MAG: hypothetical protein KatS3mg003_2328 [Candidatus Nitrosocaldaceae archaeon]|nr:MAG: hypothetical protein KatS3mg003_2328 [Candidatus Nitrosocaldaceae archaeon]
MSMARCSCGKSLRIVEVCSWDGCKRLYICLGCNKEEDKCSCKL